MVDYKKQGAANRRKGAAFERKARADMESNGFDVSKWQNNVDLEKHCFYAAKQKFINGRGMGLGSGFPDFVAFMEKSTCKNSHPNFKVIFVECKTNGKLSRIEKDKMNWITKRGYQCWIAYDEEGKVKYREFVEC